MAVHAVHGAVFASANWSSVGLVSLEMNRRLARIVRVVDGRDDLAVLVGGDVLNRRVHVQVAAVDSDAASGPVPPILSRSTVVSGVFFSSSEYLRFTTSLSPVNTCGQWHCSQVSRAGRSCSHRRGNRPVIGVERDRINLAQARKFRLREPARAGPDMALHARDALVRRVLVGGEFRLHHGVAGLPAKADRVHVLDALIRSDAEYHAVRQSEPANPAGDLAHRGYREIDSRINRRKLPGFGESHPPPNRAGWDQDQSDYENSGKNEEEDEPDIRVNRSAAHDIEQPKTDQRGRRTRRQNGSRHGQRIPAKVRGKTESGGGAFK